MRVRGPSRRFASPSGQGQGSSPGCHIHDTAILRRTLSGSCNEDLSSGCQGKPRQRLLSLKLGTNKTMTGKE